MNLLQKTGAILATLACGFLPLSCAPSNSSTDSKTPSNCLFDGTTRERTTPGGAFVTTVTLSQVSGTKRNCVDAVKWSFTPGLPGANVRYASGPFTDTSGNPIKIEGAGLVVEFTGTSVGEPSDPARYVGPLTLSTSQLAHITSATMQATTAGNMAWVLDIDKRRPFAVSASTMPAYFIISIG